MADSENRFKPLIITRNFSWRLVLAAALSTWSFFETLPEIQQRPARVNLTDVTAPTMLHVPRVKKECGIAAPHAVEWMGGTTSLPSKGKVVPSPFYRYNRSRVVYTSDDDHRPAYDNCAPWGDWDPLSRRKRLTIPKIALVRRPGLHGVFESNLFIIKCK